MKELKELKHNLEERLHKIRNKEEKNTNDLYEYEKTQKDLRKVNDVIIMLASEKEED